LANRLLFAASINKPSERTVRWPLGFAVATVLAFVVALGMPAGAGAAPFVYVTDTGANAVLQFRATGPDGALAPLSPASVPAGHEAFGLALAPSGAYAYTSDGGLTAPSGSASQYSIAATSGLLSPLDPPSIPVDGQPSLIAVHPNGASAYVTDFPTPGGGGGVYMFTIGAGGELTPKPTPRVTAGTFPEGIALTPDGSSAYVTDNDGFVWQFDVDAGGVLHPKTPPSVPAGTTAFGIAVTPDGRSVFAANLGDGTVSQYRVGAGGALMPLGTVPAGTEPNIVAISPDGGSAYVVNRSGSVSQYDVGTDGLVPKSPPTVPAGTSPFGIAVSGDGATVYVADQGDPSVIWQYAVDGDGGLSPLSPPSVPAGSQAGSVAVSPGQPSNEFSFTKVKKLKHKGKARLTLEVPGPGGVELAGKGVKKRTGHTSGPKRRMLVASKGKAKRKLRRKGKAKVKAKVTYTPDGGTANTKSKKIKLIKK
jgi:DNA-binding beta-propeller fold protein YncE